MATEPIPHFDRPSIADHHLAPVNRRPEDHKSWNHVIDELLVNWRRYPELIEDVGVDAPSSAAIAASSQAACLLRDQSAPVPTNISPTSDGGIAFHYEHSGVLFTIEFDADGRRELRFHFDGQLVRLGDSA